MEILNIIHTIVLAVWINRDRKGPSRNMYSVIFFFEETYKVNSTQTGHNREPVLTSQEDKPSLQQNMCFQNPFNRLPGSGSYNDVHLDNN